MTMDHHREVERLQQQFNANQQGRADPRPKWARPVSYPPSAINQAQHDGMAQELARLRHKLVGADALLREHHREVERLQHELRKLRWSVLVLLIAGTVTWLALWL
jgi:hypothetical protein